jgi:hypothetical protein
MCSLIVVMLDLYGGLVHITFGIRPTLNTNHLFGTWSNTLGGSFKRQLLDVTSVFC